MNDLIDHSVLNARCRADLRRLLTMFKSNSQKVSNGPVEYDHESLPQCIEQLTSSKAGITKPPMFRPTTAKTTLKVPTQWTSDPSVPKQERKFLESVDERLKRTDSSSRKRTGGALPLTAKEQDFIYRYAEFKHGSKVLRGEEAHEKSFAYRAYTDAFLSFMGRPPSTAELQEADRLTFVEGANARLGVVSKPHAATPHRHISNSSETVTFCGNQVHPPERRVERAAREGSTLLDRTTFSSQSGSPPSSPQRSIGRGRSSASTKLPEIASPEAKKFCSKCNARLPPRLIKTLCPACDK
ncbi:Hypothetical protein, putative [Bodo saltans]|uniref:Uncharacterized protein n=1 Tax=Bodo saltans TaxID=75058 RepID=A0A0S4J4T0_BODSA|nr:Hypothetical protein, putative [Bodo saltans]|eukprot:CUG81760.1 Hypothetical protein, putative [Bodo saltans]